MFGRIDHIGIAVEDIDAALALYEASFEMTVVHRETVESQGVEAVLLDVGDGHVELLAAARAGDHRRQSSPARARGCTTSPTPSRTSTRPWSASRPPGLS